MSKLLLFICLLLGLAQAKLATSYSLVHGRDAEEKATNYMIQARKSPLFTKQINKNYEPSVLERSSGSITAPENDNNKITGDEFVLLSNGKIPNRSFGLFLRTKLKITLVDPEFKMKLNGKLTNCETVKSTNKRDHSGANNSYSPGKISRCLVNIPVVNGQSKQQQYTHTV